MNNKPIIQFKKPITLGFMIAIEEAWRKIGTNDKLLQAGTITRDEWFKRRDAIAADLKARGY